jgi:Flp pilus assembly protein TadD
VAFALFLLLAQAATFEESFRSGLLALQRNDLEAAEANLGAAAKLAPNNGRVWVALARTYWKLKQNSNADAAAAKAEAVAPADPLVLTSLVIYYSESAQLPKAAAAQAKYAGTVPSDTAAREKAESLYFEAVQPLLQQQNFSEAIAILGKAGDTVKNSAQLELASGVAYYGLRRFDEAAHAFLRTISLAPEIDRPYVFLGRFLTQVPALLPEITQRFAAYEKAHPEVAAGYLLHAKALNAQSIEPENARQLLEKAISLEEKNASAHFELGVVLDRTHQYGDALRELQRAAALDPADSATHYRLSRIYDRLGRPDDARKERELHAKLAAAEEAARQ